MTSDVYYNGREKKDPWLCSSIPALECEGEQEEEGEESEYDPEEDTDL